jgi:hyaluronate lyase
MTEFSIKRFLNPEVIFLRRFPVVLAAFLLVSFSRADEYDDLRLKWRDTLVGTGYDTQDPVVISKLNSIASTANSHWASMDKSPSRTFLWSDLAGTTLSADITDNYNRLRAMAIAYATPGCSLAGNTALLADIAGGLDWMHANRYNPTVSIYNNWWDFEIGSPYRLMDIVVLLHDQLTPAQRTNYTAAVNKFTPSASSPAPGGTTGTFTGANRMAKIRVVAVLGVVIKDGSKLANARDAFSNLFEYVTSGDGFYEDGSFIQHDDLAYTAGYGQGLLVHMAPVFALLSGSTWAVTEPAQGNMYRWVYDSFEPIIYRGAAWDLVRGRFVSAPNGSPQTVGHDIMDSILEMSQFAPPADAARMKSMVKEWALADTVRNFVAQRPLASLALARTLINDPGVERRGELTGHFQFPAMDRVVHLGKGYGFGLSMCSTRIANFESINNNNLRGWFTGDGMTMLYNADLDAFADAHAPTVDAYRMPGVTADVTHNKLPHNSNSIGLRAQGQDTRSPHNWVGGTKLDHYGAAGMQFKGVGVTLTGKKSWFMFDDEVVCLGAGITSTDNRPIETTVENRKLGPTGSNAFTVNGVTKPNVPGWSEAMNGVNWAHLAGTASAADIGYYFPQSAMLTAVRESRTGAWADVDADSSIAPITRNYLRMGFEHGGNPGNATYQYVLLPGRPAKRVGHYAAQPQITVLNNNANVQAVRENTLGITAANFWTDNTFTYGGITSNRKASVMVRDDGTFIDVAVSDPTQANTGSIQIQLASSATALVSADAGITVTQTNPGIHMTVNVNGARGKTFRARFFLGTAETVNLEPVADTYGHDAAASVDTNYGTENRVIVKKANTGFNRESYLRFDVPAWNGIMLGASLRLMPINLSVPGVNGVSVVSDNTWIESGPGGLTWNNRPTSSATLLSTWTPALDVTVNADVSAAITNSGLVSFHLRAITETSNGIVYYGSRENTTAANRPQLALTLGHTPPEVSLISPSDGDVITTGGTVTITADAVPTDGAVTSVAFYNGDTLVGTDTTAPYSITTTLPGGLHSLTAVATDSNSLTKTSLAHEVEIAFPPNAAAGNLDTLRNVPVDVDLRTLASDVETPDAGLRFTLGAASNGSVILLADGHTARFTPAADYSGPAGFDYTVTDATSDDRTVFNYDFQASDATDVSGRGRDGTIHLQGTGTATFTAELPTALAPLHTQSLRLTENGAAGAARVERVVAAEDLNVATDNWTISGWFNRATTTNMDVILQIGESGGFNPNALTLAFYTTSNTLELRNYNINTLDIGISQTNVPAGQWHHYAITRDGGTLSLYLNGVLVGSDDSFGFSFTPATAIKFGAPSNTTVLDRWFNGSLADPAVFKGALNAVDIAKLGTLPTAYFAGLTATNTVNVEVTAPPFVPTAITWEGGSADTDWSTNDNWSDNVAPNGNDITFNITAASASGVTNTVDSSIPIASLSYRFEDATLQHTTAIAAGRTLTVIGNFSVLTGTAPAGPTNVSISGASGTLNVTGTTFQVINPTVSTTNSTTSLDMSGLGTLTANLTGASSLFRLGGGGASGLTSGNVGTLKLAQNSKITASIVGVSDNTNFNTPQKMLLGSGTNIINTDAFRVGSSSGGRSSGEVSFNTGTGTLLLRGLDGVSAVPNMHMINATANTGNVLTSVVNLDGHSVDAKIGTLRIARRTGTGGGSTATLSFDTGTLEVGTVTMATNENVANVGTTHATIHIGGGTANFGTINMAESTADPSATTNATLNLTGGVTTVTGNIVRIGGSGTTHAIVNLNGGVLDMANGNIGDAANPVTLILASGTLQNVAQINGGADFVKTGTGTLILSGNNSYTGNTVVEEGILSVTNPGLADASTVSIGTLANPGAAFLNLPNSGNDTVTALFINGVGQPAGRTYGNASSVLPVIATAAITGPGTITVPGSGTPYSLWADSFFPGNDVSDPDGDNDNDGLTNQQEFAFGLSPVDGSSVNPILVQLNKAAGTFTYQRRAGTGLTFRILTSTDLRAWPEDETAAQVPGPVDGNGNETVVVTLTDAPLTATNFFVRVAAD